MKKTVNIHLCEQVFTMDEDACALLEGYLKNTHSYFSRMDDGEEIANDIENHVAELLCEYRDNGSVCITLAQIEEIIARIGNPEELGAGSADKDGANSGVNEDEIPPIPPHPTYVQKKFFRDPETALLGGVISGFCHYFGLKDVTIWRLVFVVLCFFSFLVSIIAYALLYLIIPPAVTPEQRLQMRGEPINFQSINEELMKGVAQTEKVVQNPAVRSFWSKALRVCFMVLLFALCVPLVIMLCLQLLMLIMGIIGLLFSIFSATASLASIPFMLGITSFFDAFPTGLNILFLLCLLCGVVLIAIPLYAVVRSLVNSSNKLSSKARMRLWWTWLGALLLGCLLTVISFFSAVMGIETGVYNVDEDVLEQRIIDKMTPIFEEGVLPTLPTINMDDDGVEIEIMGNNDEVVKLVANDSFCKIEVNGADGKELINIHAKGN